MRHHMLYSLCLSILIYSLALAESPSDNDIPTLLMRTYGSETSYITDFSLDLFCELLWQNLDAVYFAGFSDLYYVQNLMSLCDSAGVYFSFSPSDIMQSLAEWADPEFRYWFRLSGMSLRSDSCFARSNADFDSIAHYMPAESLYDLCDSIAIKGVIETLNYRTSFFDFLWYYEVYDEANSWQRRHSVEDTLPWNDYLPNVYTQDTLANGALSLEEVEPSGIFSLQKYYAENDPNYPTPLAMNFALLHFIDKEDYTGLTGNIDYGTFEDQARSVRAMMQAEFQPPPSGQFIPLPVENYPDFISFDYYPFRYVCPESASTAPEMCDSDWLFLIDHIEEGLDSTVVPAWEYDCPVYFFVQSFGVAGGPLMWDESIPPEISYESYTSRKPAPQEFRMLCNLALLHQIKGIFPYNLCSYREFNTQGDPISMNSSLLDCHNIPFDADYEDWRYTGRWPGDSMAYIRPDSIPPWIDGYDPLFSMHTPPDTSGDGERAEENWYTWHFQPYADLYNNLYDILADVKIIGPEMYDLWWSEENGTPYWDVAEIVMPDSDLHDNYVPPVIRVFAEESNDNAYLYYVNRFCGEYYYGDTDRIPVVIRIHDTECPGDVYRNAIDHLRRCLIPVDKGLQDLYYYSDTLEAGQGRLVEFVDTMQTIQADLRITSPDVFTYRLGYEGRDREHRYTAGTDLYVGGTFYNMGTDTTGDVEVTFTDLTSSTILGKDTISLDGLSGYYQPDSVSALILWSTDSTDIGAHIIEIEADSIPGEEAHDNAVQMTVLLEPRDYATAVRLDAWDMDDDTTVAWNTSDIEAVANNWDTATGWTDSVSGMFEGVVLYDDSVHDYRADISLAIPASPSQYLDTDLYHMLSLGIVGYNPNPQPGGAFGLYVQWRDSHGTLSDWKNLLAGTDYAVGNGWDQYTNIGPIDLDSVSELGWGSGTASALWLRINVSLPQGSPPDPIDVRIGWAKLEESAQ